MNSCRCLFPLSTADGNFVLDMGLFNFYSCCNKGCSFSSLEFVKLNICVSVYHLHLHMSTALSSPWWEQSSVINRDYSPLERLFKYAVFKPFKINTLSSTQKRANYNIAEISEYFLLKICFSFCKL